MNIWDPCGSGSSWVSGTRWRAENKSHRTPHLVYGRAQGVGFVSWVYSRLLSFRNLHTAKAYMLLAARVREFQEVMKRDATLANESSGLLRRTPA